MNAAEIQNAERQSTVGRDCRESLPSSMCERLDSWKEIACYSRRSIRCVQRWEKNDGLPILPASTRVPPRCTRTGRNWMSGREGRERHIAS